MTLPDHIPQSKLGTKEYWNTLYTHELTNHTTNPSDIGTIWFNDSDAQSKLLDFLARYPPQTSFLDLGCGNGAMLLSLRQRGFHGPALGVDYSPQSLELARRVLGGGDDFPPVRFAEWDILQEGGYEAVLEGGRRGWDVVLDKGTFDAVSLSGEGGRACEVYPRRVVRLVRKGGVLLVTSCNWTEEELAAWFVGAHDGDGRFVVAGRVEYKTFSFGGVKGQAISTLCFRKV